MAFTKNFQMLEQKSTVDPMYLIKAKNCITPERRKTLFLWISAVSFKGFEPPVEVPIFETTRLLDLFLSRNIQAKLSYRDFQIIALSCLVISAEIMDCRYFSFRQRLPDIIETMKEVYSFDAITHWVQHIRKSLLIDPKKTFGRLQVNSHLFFSFFSKALGIEKEPFMFGNMLLELSLMDHHFLRFRQSLIGFSCACLVLNFFLGGDVTKLVQKYQEFFCEEEVRSCGRELAQLTLKENMISLIEEKYQSKGNLNVSRFSFHPSETQYKKRSSSLE
jgi:hypothetical protein